MRTSNERIELIEIDWIEQQLTYVKSHSYVYAVAAFIFVLRAPGDSVLSLYQLIFRAAMVDFWQAR